MKRMTATLILLMGILFIIILWDKMIISILAGEGGVLYKRFSGTVVDRVYKERIYAIFPWNIMTKYNLRVMEEKIDLEVLSKQGLKIKILISIRYRPDPNMLGILHQQIGPNYLNSVVIPEVEAVIRRYFGQFSDEEIYTSKKAILEKIVSDSGKRLSDKYIILDDLIIRKISFPKVVEESIQSKITQYHKYKEYEYKIEKEKLEAQRKEIEATGISKYKDIISKNITKEYLTWEGVQATKELASSPNSKTVIIGSGDNGLPIILNTGQDVSAK
jgi:regulator of protease activity HflC (stomatin/prohibitin superfamily)